MPTLISTLKKSENFLKQKGISNALFNAEILFANALNCKRIDLYLRYNYNLTDEQLATIRTLLTRRAHNEPLQYIIGEWPFHELSLFVDRRALIPRPETEFLVELLIYFFNKQKYNNIKILDLGTGTGAIALSLAKSFPKSHVTATDISTDALSLAKKNAIKNNISNITFLRSDWYSNINDTFNLIVSNPPYLTHTEWENTQPEIKNFEPKIALVADNDGKSDLIQIIKNSHEFLKEKGVLVLETGDTQHDELLNIASQWFQHSKSIKDQFGRNRFLFFKRS